MREKEVVEVLEKEKQYMLGHGGDYQAKAIGIAIEIINKNIPMNPIKSKIPRYGMGYDYYDWFCPSCGDFLAYECDYEREKIHHCICGQRLKWEENEE